MPRKPGKSRSHPQVPAHIKPISNSESPLVTVVIPVMNEIRTLARVIHEARQVHPDTEVLVVSNGSRDGSKEQAERMGARVLSFPEPLGHDVGRSIGALHAKGEIVLFTDADIVIPATQLRTFVDAVAEGTDVALNRYNGPIRRKKAHRVVVSKYALNSILSLPHLQGASQTAIPHAMSKKAIGKIGARNLSVPPKAQAIAVLEGLKVDAVCYVDVGKTNPGKKGRTHPLGELIIGDHLEAIHYVLGRMGPRGGRPGNDQQSGMVV